MNKYESVIIVKPDVDTKEIIKKVEEIVNSNGNMEKIDELGTKKLAYEIRGNKEGQYIVFYFEGGSGLVEELERNYRIIEDIIKFITIKVENEEE